MCFVDFVTVVSRVAGVRCLIAGAAQSAAAPCQRRRRYAEPAAPWHGVVRSSSIAAPICDVYASILDRGGHCVSGGGWITIAGYGPVTVDVVHVASGALRQQSSPVAGPLVTTRGMAARR